MSQKKQKRKEDFKGPMRVPDKKVHIPIPSPRKLLRNFHEIPGKQQHSTGKHIPY